MTLNLKKGSTDKAAISDLQLALTRVGYLTAVDGDFGPQTLKNLKGFQEANSLKPDGIYGPITQAVMAKKLKEIGKKPDPTPVSSSETPWMDWLLANKGQKEIPGNKANPFITELFQYTSLKNHPMATTDETAWCAACANAALVKNGYKGTNSAAAASFDNYGTKLDKPKYGCVITLRHPGGGRHVAFFLGYNAQGRLRLLGGNQSNSLKESLFSASELVAARWPVKK